LPPTVILALNNQREQEQLRSRTGISAGSNNFRFGREQTPVRAPKPPAGRRARETRRRRARPTAETGDCPKFSPLFSARPAAFASADRSHSLNRTERFRDAFRFVGQHRVPRRAARSAPAAHRTAVPAWRRGPLWLPRAASPRSPRCLAGENSLTRKAPLHPRGGPAAGLREWAVLHSSPCSVCLFCFLS
jgi:hypothetical protein